MVTRDFANLVLNVRRDSKQRVLKEALLVPWQQLAEGASALAEWHTIILWVRVIAEAADQLPEIVRSELRSRCPGFLDSRSLKQEDDLPIWKSLEEWVTVHCFAKARAEGWFDALMYYAYKDLRTEQAWTAWERTKAGWRDTVPARWPTLEEWTIEVLATRSLAQPGTEKARAVQALGKVEAARLNSAVTDVLERRALALWVDSVSKPEQPLDEVVMTELRGRCPALLHASGGSRWVPPLSSRLLRNGALTWQSTARSEGWYAALRYAVVHHPRYQRLIHYNQRCPDEWSQARPVSFPSFANWLANADAYCAGRKV
jgi:hypothetical protein